MGFDRRALVAGVACAGVALTSLTACSSSSPAPKSGDFCSVYTSAKTQVEAAGDWVDAKGNVNIVKAVTGVTQLIDTLGKFDASAPAGVKSDLDKVVPVYDELKSAALSGDQARIQKAVQKLSDPGVQKSLTSAMQKAAKACS